ncbi:hypothetical protein HDV05_008337 [Chytridiales sp. JEL 0842]|nr:hypothetical protein HDV05_008337 [Chytridiales sp. JEL 0842]
MLEMSPSASTTASTVPITNTPTLSDPQRTIDQPEALVEHEDAREKNDINSESAEDNGGQYSMNREDPAQYDDLVASSSKKDYDRFQRATSSSSSASSLITSSQNSSTELDRSPLSSSSSSNSSADHIQPVFPSEADSLAHTNVNPDPTIPDSHHAFGVPSSSGTLVVVESLREGRNTNEEGDSVDHDPSFWEDLITFLRYWGIIAKETDDRNRINYITGLKGLACLAVFNIFGKDFHTAKGMEVFGTGWLAIPLFFLLSGRLNCLRLSKSLDFPTLKSVVIRRTIRFIWILTGASLLFWYLCTNEFYGRLDMPTRKVGFLPSINHTQAFTAPSEISLQGASLDSNNGSWSPVMGLHGLEVERSPTFWGAFKQPINLLARELPMMYPGPSGLSSGFWTMTIDLRNSYFLFFLITLIKTYSNFKWPILWALLVTFYIFQCWTGVFVAGYMIAEIRPRLVSLSNLWKRVVCMILTGVLVALFFVTDEQFDKYNNYILVDTWSGAFHPKNPIPFQVFQYRGFWGAVCLLLVAEMSQFFQGLLTVKPLMFVGKVSVGVYVVGPLVLSTFRPWLSKILFPTVANSILAGTPSKVPFLEGWLIYLLSLSLTVFCAFIFKITFDNHSFKIAEWAEWILDGGDEPPSHTVAPQELEKGHAHYLNGLRGIASVGVFLKHSSALLDGYSLEVLVPKTFNVPLFFVLSGRVIGLQIVKRGDIKTLAGNILRRPFRLTLPVVYAQILYWFLLTYTNVFSYSNEAAKRISGYYPFSSNRNNSVYNLTFVGAVTQPLLLYINGTAPQYPIDMQWTLPNELINAYAIFICAVIAVLYKRRQWVVLLPVFIVAYIYQVWLAAFLLGFFMSQYMSYMKNWNIYYRHLAGLGFAGIVVLNAIYGERRFNRVNNQITVNQDGGMGYISDMYPLFWQFDPRGILSAWAILHCIELMELLQWVFTRKPILFLGRVSYGVYLAHPIVLASFRSWLFVQWTSPDRNPRDTVVPASLAWPIFFLSLLVTIVVGYVLHKTADVHSYIFSKWLERVMLGEEGAVDFTLKKERVKMYNWFFDPFSAKKKWAKEVAKWGKVKKAWEDTRVAAVNFVQRRKKNGE